MKLNIEIDTSEIIYSLMEGLSYYDNENGETVVNLGDIEDQDEQKKAFNKALATIVRDGIIDDVKRQYNVAIDTISKNAINTKVSEILDQSIEPLIVKKIEDFMAANRIIIKDSSSWNEKVEEISTDDYITRLIDSSINGKRVDKNGNHSSRSDGMTYAEYFTKKYVNNAVEERFLKQMKVQEEVIEEAIKEAAGELMKDRIGNNLKNVVARVIKEIDKKDD